MNVGGGHRWRPVAIVKGARANERYVGRIGRGRRQAGVIGLFGKAFELLNRNVDRQIAIFYYFTNESFQILIIF
jgi:hypothetical protein